MFDHFDDIVMSRLLGWLVCLRDSSVVDAIVIALGFFTRLSMDFWTVSFVS